MKKRPLALLFSVLSILAYGVFAEQVKNHREAEELDVAQLLVNLSPGIVAELNPPATGAERMVTTATVSEEGHIRTYYIEGQDVYHNGRVLSTFWIRLQKQISGDGISIASGHEGAHPALGHTLESETQNLIASLLNGLYDIAYMDLDHSQVELKLIKLSNLDPWTYELIGENKVCKHMDLNTFKMVVARTVDRNRTSYESMLHLPYTLTDDERAAIGGMPGSMPDFDDVIPLPPLPEWPHK
jgi:hypothetical protein